MEIYLNNTVLLSDEPRYAGQEITIAIDSSKRNTGICIGDAFCRERDILEFDGTRVGTAETDTLVMCKEQRDFLRRFLHGAKVKHVGIENIVTVNKSTRAAGMSQHMSRFKITAVFMSFISFFQDEYNIIPMLINNQAWKAAVLPERFRAADMHKGSLEYFKSIQSKYGAYSDDATDAICILRYMKKVLGLESLIKITTPEFLRGEAKTYITGKSMHPKLQDISTAFSYNSALSLKENTSVMCNHIENHKKYGIAKVSIEVFTYDEIYKLSRGVFDEKSDEVLLVVERSNV